MNEKASRNNGAEFDKSDFVNGKDIDNYAVSADDDSNDNGFVNYKDMSDFIPDDVEIEETKKSDTNYVPATKAGLLPCFDELPYEITTSFIENYFQRKMNVVVNGMRKQNMYSGADIDVRIITVEMGSKFVPFTVLLPMSVVKQKNNKNKPKNELAMFNPKDYHDETVTIIEPIMKLFSSYMYNKDDGAAFFSPDWRRDRGVSNNIAAILKRNRLPNVQKFNNGSVEYISFLIDPIRVFYDALEIKSFPRSYHVEINGWQKIRSGEFKYYVKRVLNKKNNKKKNKGGRDVADELNRKMTGRYGK